MPAENEKMKSYIKKIYLLIILVLSFNSQSFCAVVHNWSKNKVKVFAIEDINSKIIENIKTGDCVEIISGLENAISVSENWILKTNESLDTVFLLGKMIKVRYNDRIGFCFDTFLINQEYVESEIKNKNVISAFDYYSKDLSETLIEKELIKDNDSNIETGKTKYSDGSLLTYEYGGYGGGFMF